MQTLLILFALAIQSFAGIGPYVDVELYYLEATCSGPVVIMTVSKVNETCVPVMNCSAAPGVPTFNYYTKQCNVSNTSIPAPPSPAIYKNYYETQACCGEPTSWTATVIGTCSGRLLYEAGADTCKLVTRYSVPNCAGGATFTYYLGIPLPSCSPSAPYNSITCGPPTKVRACPARDVVYYTVTKLFDAEGCPDNQISSYSAVRYNSSATSPLPCYPILYEQEGGNPYACRGGSRFPGETKWRRTDCYVSEYELDAVIHSKAQITVTRDPTESPDCCSGPPLTYSYTVTGRCIQTAPNESFYLKDDCETYVQWKGTPLCYQRPGATFSEPRFRLRGPECSADGRSQFCGRQGPVNCTPTPPPPPAPPSADRYDVVVLYSVYDDRGLGGICNPDSIVYVRTTAATPDCGTSVGCTLNDAATIFPFQSQILCGVTSDQIPTVPVAYPRYTIRISKSGNRSCTGLRNLLSQETFRVDTCISGVNSLRGPARNYELAKSMRINSDCKAFIAWENYPICENTGQQGVVNIPSNPPDPTCHVIYLRGFNQDEQSYCLKPGQEEPRPWVAPPLPPPVPVPVPVPVPAPVPQRPSPPAPVPPNPTQDQIFQQLNNPQVIKNLNATILNFLVPKPTKNPVFGSPVKTADGKVTWKVALKFDHALLSAERDAIKRKLRDYVAGLLGVPASSVNIDLDSTGSGPAKRALAQETDYDYDAIAVFGGAATLVASALLSLIFFSALFF